MLRAASTAWFSGSLIERVMATAATTATAVSPTCTTFFTPRCKSKVLFGESHATLLTST